MSFYCGGTKSDDCFLILDQHSMCLTTDLPLEILKGKYLKEVKVFSWMACLRGPNTVDRLFSICPTMALYPSWCSPCLRELEGMDLIFLCSFSKIWDCLLQIILFTLSSSLIFRWKPGAIFLQPSF